MRNTAQGMINAINNSGLGLTASFYNRRHGCRRKSPDVGQGTAAQAAALALTNTGIMIQGSVGSGNAPTSASFSGSATATGAVNTDILTGSITLQVGNGATISTVTMAQRWPQPDGIATGRCLSGRLLEKVHHSQRGPRGSRLGTLRVENLLRFRAPRAATRP